MSFKYNVVSLIELVKARTCLWDKTDVNHRDKSVRDICWREIFEYFEPNYNEMSENEKKEMGDSVIKKWANMRDAFIKSLRVRDSRGTRRKYIYGKYMQFLLKTVNKDKDNVELHLSDLELSLSPSSDSPPSPFDSKFVTDSPQLQKPLDTIKKETFLEAKKPRYDIVNTVPVADPTKSNDKEILLLSFLPYVRDMSEQEMMDLQIDVLTSIRRIKEKRMQNFDAQLPSTSNN